MTDLDLRDIIPCKLCMALITYDTRALHLEWHAKMNARLLQPRDQTRMAGSDVGQCGAVAEQVLSPAALDMAGIRPAVVCHLAFGHLGSHSNGTEVWTRVHGR